MIRNIKDIQKQIKKFKPLSESQLCQDLFVLILNGFKRNGFFVEFGACDGILYSNSVLLEKKYGWNGIIAEPQKSFHSKLKINRSCIIDHRAVFNESNKKIKFVELEDNPDLSGIKETFLNDNHTKKRNSPKQTEYLVDTVSLEDLLVSNNAPNNIDYISIDTEGSEFDIIEAFDFKKYNVGIFTIEHNYIDDKRKNIQSIMERNEYKRILENISEWDDWYVSNEILRSII